MSADPTPEEFARLLGATFAILDGNDMPACCGVFVSQCGVALTTAHDSKRWVLRRKRLPYVRAAAHDGATFTLRVVSMWVGELDIAILKLEAPAEHVSRAYLALPPRALIASELVGAPVCLVHSSIAWSSGATSHNFARETGYISTSSSTKIHYSVPSYKGHSGAALLLRGRELIGLHAEGFNDLPDMHSETSPSTSADAVRLDLPQVATAVARAVADTHA